MTADNPPTARFTFPGSDGFLVQAYRWDPVFSAYQGARHEVFNETNRDEVEADLMAWLDRVVPAR